MSIDPWLKTSQGPRQGWPDGHRRFLEQEPDQYRRLAIWYLEGAGPQSDLFLTNLLGDVSRDELADLIRHLGPDQLSTALDRFKQSGGKPGRPLVGAFTEYLRALEADPERFDRAAVFSRKALTHLYASLHIAPDRRAAAILFARNPPHHSRLWALRALTEVTDLEAGVRLIRDHALTLAEVRRTLGRIETPYWTPLLQQTSPEEIGAALRFLRDKGVLNNPAHRLVVAGALGSEAVLARRLRAGFPEPVGDEWLAAMDEKELRKALARL